MRIKLHRALNREKLLLLTLGACVTVAVLLLSNTQPWLFKLMDYRLYDVMLRSHPSTSTSDSVVVVDIDEKSLARVGQWQWPRHRFAVLLDNLKHAGALAVGMDIVFAEPDRTSPANVRESLMRSFPQAVRDVRFVGVPPVLLDNDALLAQVLATGPYVLGYTFLFGQTSDAVPDRHVGEHVLKPITVAVKSTIPGHDAEVLPHLPAAGGAVYPLDQYLEAAPGAGFFSTGNDDDGVIRRVPLLLSKGGKVYPNLALATLLEAWRYQGDRVLTPLLKVTDYGVESLKVGDSVIPVDALCRVMVNYRGGARKFPYISASDVIEQLPEALEQVAGKFVFIGTSAKGLEDIRTTPFTPFYPGVEAHATILDNILTGDFIRVPHWARGAEAAATLLCGLTTTLLLVWAPARLVVLPFLAMGASAWFGSRYLFSSQGYWISPFYALMALGATFLILTVVKFWREEKQKRFIQGAFAQYLAPAIIERILDDPDALSLAGEEKEVSIQFSDIRGFTSLSEQLSPSQVSELLQDYLTPMTRIITARSGTLDKFIGDAVMAFWNAPLDVPEHQVRAVEAAMEQLEALERLNATFIEKYGFRVSIGIGLHAGLVRVGNMGSADLFDYTLIGDNVNLASRLEGLTKYYGQQIVVSGAIRDACGDAWEFPLLDRVRVKGKEEPIAIYTVRSVEQARAAREELDAHAGALALYEAARFGEACEAFTLLASAHPGERFYAMYAERCSAMGKNPPGEGWDGVFTHTSK
ncbi:MAG: CHASE2 domain-containing protein [Desulfovibrionaceae bacterium]